MSKFELKITIPARLIGTVVELLQDEGELISIQQYKETRRVKHHTNQRYEQPASEIVFQALAQPATAIGLSKALKMPVGTVSSSLDKLQKAGRVEKSGKNHTWRRR
jgi:DNA-binding MarR family transcriptional regulator